MVKSYHEISAGKGICLIILGVLIWLNAAYAVVSWGAFVGIITVLLGIKLIILAGCCKKKKK